jgi:FAD synthase
VLCFDGVLRALAAADFIAGMGVVGLGVRWLVLGFDSMFGRARGGPPVSLR